MTGHDDQDSEPVAVVNESFTKAFWSSNLGDHRFKFGPPAASGPWVRIVGVVTILVRERQMSQPHRVSIFLSDQDPYKGMAIRESWFVLRTTGDSLTLTHAVRMLSFIGPLTSGSPAPVDGASSC